MSRFKWVLLSLTVLLIVLFGLFVYPGMYKYDKLNQKYPVKINRITGETKILYSDGWKNADDYSSAATEMEQYKEQILDLINSQNEKIKIEVIESVKQELEKIKEDSAAVDFSSVRNRDKTLQSDLSLEENMDYFEKGDSSDKVEQIMGTPDSITGSELYETWSYGLSTVSFKNGNVSGWRNSGKNLKLK